MPRDEQFDTFVQVGIILQSMPDKRIRTQVMVKVTSANYALGWGERKVGAKERRQMN